jgi:hypothetical protein
MPLHLRILATGTSLSLTTNVNVSRLKIGRARESPATIILDMSTLLHLEFNVTKTACGLKLCPGKLSMHVLMRTLLERPEGLSVTN